MTKLYIIGEINEESYLKFSEELSDIEDNEEPGHTIEVEMNSHGGCAIDAIAFYDRIKNSRCKVNFTVYGQVSSAAVLVFAAGNKRVMAPEAWMMVHEDEDKLSTRTSGFERHASHMRMFETQWCRLLSLNSNITAEAWAELHQKTTYLTAKDCVMLKIATEILTKPEDEDVSF